MGEKRTHFIAYESVPVKLVACVFFTIVSSVTKCDAGVLIASFTSINAPRCAVGERRSYTRICDQTPLRRSHPFIAGWYWRQLISWNTFFTPSFSFAFFSTLFRLSSLALRHVLLMFTNHINLIAYPTFPAFHEAVSDAIALSVSTPKHLQTLGLVQKSVDDTAHDINFLFSLALDKVSLRETTRIWSRVSLCADQIRFDVNFRSFFCHSLWLWMCGGGTSSIKISSPTNTIAIGGC